MKSENFDIDTRNDPFFAEYQRALEMLQIPDWGPGLQEMDRLARSGSIMSILLIADAMWAGWMYDQDLPSAEAWYKVAVASGSARGLYGLGRTHLKMNRFSEAIEELEAAIAEGFPPAYNALACMYFNGQGVPVDRPRALQLWRKGSALGHLPSKRNLLQQSLHGRFGFWRRIVGIVSFLPIAVEYATVQVMNRHTDRLR